MNAFGATFRMLASPGQVSPGLVFTGLLLLLALVAALGVAVLIARRLYRRNLSGPPATQFTVEQLDAMRAAGQITDQEFAILRRKALAFWASTNVQGKLDRSGDQLPAQKENGQAVLRPPPEGDDGNTGRDNGQDAGPQRP